MIRSTLALFAFLALCAACADPGLVAHWSFDEGGGTRVADLSGNGNDGTVHDAKFVKNNGGYCLEFDGQTSYVDCGSGPSLDLEEALTLEGWVFPAVAPDAEPGVFGKHFQSYLVTYYRDGQCWAYINAGAHNVHAPLGAGAWHHVAFTFDGRHLKLYVDGKLQASREAEANRANKSGRFLIGCVMGDPNAPDPAYTHTSHFLGMIDEVRVYNRALSPEEVAGHASREAPLFEITEPFRKVERVARLMDGDLRVELGARGEFQVDANRESYLAESRFSYPGDRIRWHLLSAAQEEGQVTSKVVKLSPIEAVVTVRGSLYDIVRRVRLHDGRVNVRDELTNRTNEPVGLMVKHDLTSRRRFESTFTPGGAENPTCFMQGSRGSLGLVIEDDLSRLRQEPVTGLRTNQVSVRMGSMALDAGRSLVFEWSLWPMARGADYHDFINQLRREWDANYTIEGPFDWIFMTNPILDKPEELKAYLQRKRVKVMALSPWLDYDPGSEDRVWSREEFRRYALKAVKALKTADPDILCVGCIETDWVTIYPEQIPGGDRLPRADQRGGGGLNAEQTKIIDNAKLPWADSVKRDRNGTLQLELYMRGGKPQTALSVYPAVGNYQYEFLMDQVKFLLDDLGLDGYYIDEFSQAWTDGIRSYQGWDGVSAELDLVTGAIKRKFVDCGYAGTQARVNLARYALDRDKIVIANTYATAAAERGIPVNRFAETWGSFDPMATPDGEEPPLLASLMRSHLGSMIGLGILGRPEKHDTARRLMKAVVTYLRHGMVYYHYVLEDIPLTGEGSGEYGPVNHMFPITPVELGEGFIIGKERTLTCVSGRYRWAGRETPSVLLFDLEGRQVPNEPVMEREGDGWRIDLKLRDWAQIAVIEGGG